MIRIRFDPSALTGADLDWWNAWKARADKAREKVRDAVLKGGLRVYTTLDPTAQANATDATAASIPEKPGFSAALVSIDPTTGPRPLARRAASRPPPQSSSSWESCTSR